MLYLTSKVVVNEVLYILLHYIQNRCWHNSGLVLKLTELQKIVDWAINGHKRNQNTRGFYTSASNMCREKLRAFLGCAVIR